SAWNRATRQLSRMGRNVALAFMGIAWFSGAFGFGGAMFGIGWAAGKELEGRGLALAGASLFALSWGVGLVFGVTSTGRLLEVGQLKAYPVRPFTLLLAELTARIADPLTLGTLDRKSVV